MGARPARDAPPAEEATAGETLGGDSGATEESVADGTAGSPRSAADAPDEDGQESADTGRPSREAPSTRAASSAAPERSSRPAPVAAKAPASADLGGPQAGVAPDDTPVAVASASPSASATAPATHADPVVEPEVDCRVTRCIALTFDDGPGRHTGRLLDLLSAEEVPATFYVIGRSAELNPALIARMAAEGHQVGGHSWSHPNLTELTPEQVAEETRSTAAAIRAAGAQPSTVRAPYGALNEAVLAAFGGLPGSGSVTWTVDTRDWEHRDPASTLAAVQAGAAPGGIVLMHDIHATTVDAVPAVIAHLRAQGYTFVTVDRLTGDVPSGSTVRGGLHP